MRTQIIFLISLIAISSVASLNLKSKLTTQGSETFQKSNLGQIILSLAELHQDGRFNALFDAIDSLVEFLKASEHNENVAYSNYVADYNSQVNALNALISAEQSQLDSDNASLNSKLYPQRDGLVKNVADTEGALASAKQALVDLDAARVEQVNAFNAAQADYQEGIQALADALPLVQQLKNQQSFLEVHVDEFKAQYGNMKSKLSKLPYGKVYVAFVQTLESSLQNFSNQQAVQQVIDLLVNLQGRLQAGLVALQSQEAENLSRYNSSRQTAVNLIDSTQASLDSFRQQLSDTNAEIQRTEEDRDHQVKLLEENNNKLDLVNKAYNERTTQHNALLTQIAGEEVIVQEAVDILNKAGVHRD